jgi:hypothetical protein
MSQATVDQIPADRWWRRTRWVVRNGADELQVPSRTAAVAVAALANDELDAGRPADLQGLYFDVTGW